MENEMIERVARSLCKIDGNDPDDIVRDGVLLWTRYDEEARAAILAMQEPTEDMITAHRNAPATSDPVYQAKFDWAAMIGAALK